MKKIYIRNIDDYAIVDDEDFDLVNKYKWTGKRDCNTYYVDSWSDKSGNLNHIRMHRLLINAKEGEKVDHINHNGLDNRKENLRICNDSQNSMNRIKPKHAKLSSYKGVFKTKNGKWVAQLKYKKKNHYLGRFKTEEEAALAYNEKAEEIFGGFACLNQVNKDNTMKESD